MRGNQLSESDKSFALRTFRHRYTKTNVPMWALQEPNRYNVQFESDEDWLANTEFLTTASGELDRNAKFCTAYPTWPDNPELRNG